MLLFNLHPKQTVASTTTKEPARSQSRLTATKKALSAVLVAALLFSLSSLGQTTTQEWTLLQSVDNVSFYYSIGSCHGAGKYLLLKVDNQNSSAVGVSWTIELSEDAKKLHFPGLPTHLAAGESKTISCERPDPLTLPMPIADDFVSPQIRIEPRVEKMSQ